MTTVGRRSSSVSLSLGDQREDTEIPNIRRRRQFSQRFRQSQWLFLLVFFISLFFLNKEKLLSFRNERDHQGLRPNHEIIWPKPHPSLTREPKKD